MEPEIIDWSIIESTFEEDCTYENINAPKWVDLSAPSEPIDDQSWFCNPDCKHPEGIEDFLKPNHRNFKVKFLRSVTISEILSFRDRDRRDGKQKGKVEDYPSGTGGLRTKATNWPYKFNEEIENMNPNLKKQRDETLSDSSPQAKKRGLKSNLSATNLMAGREVLNQITEFCGELKKLARNGLTKGRLEKVSGELKDVRVGERERRPLLVVEEIES